MATVMVLYGNRNGIMVIGLYGGQNGVHNQFRELLIIGDV